VQNPHQPTPDPDRDPHPVAHTANPCAYSFLGTLRWLRGSRSVIQITRYRSLSATQQNYRAPDPNATYYFIAFDDLSDLS
jgi:hypothetical protein